MKRFLAALAICGLAACSAEAQVQLPAEPEPGILGGCTAVGGIAAGLSATNPGLAVLFITFCVILVEDVTNNAPTPTGEDR